MNEKKSLLVCDARLDEDFGSRPSIVGPGIRSILAVPVQTDERVIGLLYLDSLHLVHEFSPEDLNLVTVMANIAGIRIQHARWMEQEEARKILARDIERAAEIQRRLLPSHPPEVAGFDLAGYNAPAIRQGPGGDLHRRCCRQRLRRSAVDVESASTRAHPLRRSGTVRRTVPPIE
jgi:sigma-B regulation protein RsbU (phosphoserine phosphatase)